MEIMYIPGTSEHSTLDKYRSSAFEIQAMGALPFSSLRYLTSGIPGIDWEGV